MKKGKWRISIDDTHVEYRYIIDISDFESINSVYEMIRKLFKSRRRKGALREKWHAHLNPTKKTKVQDIYPVKGE